MKLADLTRWLRLEPASRPQPAPGRFSPANDWDADWKTPCSPAPQDGLSLQQLHQEAHRSSIEGKEVYTAHLSASTNLQEQHSGLVELPKGLPTLILPDLHGRRQYLLAALSQDIEGETAFERLRTGRLNLVCLGDGMHAEKRAAERWKLAEEAHLQGQASSHALDSEMLENLSTMKMVMLLKQSFPSHFHYIRGNHDEVLGRCQKYTETTTESELVRNWMEQRFGRDFVGQWSAFEESMPLVVRGENFVASHAAPGQSLTRKQIEERSYGAFRVLAWTDNRKWGEEDPARRSQFQGMLSEMQIPSGHWIVGHRPVDQGLYRQQMGGQLVQINDSNRYLAALVPAQGRFEPARDVFAL